MFVSGSSRNHSASLYTAGIQLLGNDELVRARPELFAPFAGGYRAVIAARAALEQADLEEQRNARAAENPETPPAPSVIHVTPADDSARAAITRTFQPLIVRG